MGTPRRSLRSHFSGWALFGGFSLGLIAAALTHVGAPPHGGVSASCFIRDTMGWLVAWGDASGTAIRMTLLAAVVGAFGAALAKREFRPQGGASPWLPLGLGVLVALGTGVFVGCPTKLHLRLGGGDPVAIVGLLGMVLGLFIASRFLAAGYHPGRIGPRPTLEAAIFPATVTLAFIAVLCDSVARGAMLDARPGYAAVAWSASLGVLLGAIAQHTRLCFTTGWIDVFFTRRAALLWAPAGAVMGVALGTVVFGDHAVFPFGKTYWAHRDFLWAGAGMVLVGLIAGLAGGCPFRQVIRASQGDRDAALLVCGLAAGSILLTRTGLVVDASFVVTTPMKVAVTGGIAATLVIARTRLSLHS